MIEGCSNKAKCRRRSLIGSDLIILLATLVHAGEAITFLTTQSADGCIEMASFLDAARHVSTSHAPRVAAAALLIASVAALIGMSRLIRCPVARIILLVPQQALLLITGLGALVAVISACYADGVLRSHVFIAWDQIWRLLAPLIYTAAIQARWRRH